MKRDARDVIPCQSPEAAPLVAVFSFKDGEIIRRRFAKGESPNSPVDCLGRGNALQVKAFPCYSAQFICLRSYLRTQKVNAVAVSVFINI